MSRPVFFAAALAFAAFFPLRADDLTAQRDQQRQTQLETDLAVRRLQTLLRILDFYQADDAAQKAAMQDLSQTLSGLSRQQMTEVIRRLDAAIAVPEGQPASADLAAAKAKHREILDTLQKMLDRFDAAQTLEQAAERFERIAKSQMALHTTNTHPDFSVLLACVVEVPALTKREWLAEQRSGKRYNTEFIDTDWHAFQQTEVRRDVRLLLEQIAALQTSLSSEQKKRVAAMEEYAKRFAVVTKVDESVEKLQPIKDFKIVIGGKNVPAPPPLPEKRQRAHNEAVELQGELAVHFRQMGRMLLFQTDVLARLLAARDRVDAAIQTQTEINETTAKIVNGLKANEPKMSISLSPEPGWELIKAPPAKVETRTPQQIADEKTADLRRKLALERTYRELSGKEATVELGAMDIENLLAPVAADIAEVIAAARDAAKTSREATTKRDAAAATEPQAKAASHLQRARAELGTRINRLQKEKTDALAALESAADKLDALIADQKRNRDETDAILRDRTKDALLKEAAAKELEILKRTVQLSRTPLPGKEKFGPLLVTAGKAMRDAVKDLAATQPASAVSHQEKALSALLEARRELGDKIADVMKTRDEIAKLEKASDQLRKLTADERRVAERAARSSTPEASQKLASQQQQLTPPTKELAQELQPLVPSAAEKIGASVPDMQQAQTKLEKNDAAPAAKDATQAAQKLAAAQQDVGDALDKLKAKELADMAALQPKSLDAPQLADQIAKALEQTEQAAEESKKADVLAKKQGDLTDKQKQVAKQAEANKLFDVAKAAEKAAAELEKGKLPEALKAQQEALDKLTPPMNNSDGQQSSAPHEPTPGDQKKIAPNPPPPPPMEQTPKERDPLEKLPMLPPPQPSAPKAISDKAISDKAITEIVETQKDLLKETEALARSKEATDMALTALAQAQAQSPPQLQERLQQAASQLAMASQELQNASPGAALAAQASAAAALQRALNTLNITLGVVEAGPPMEYQLQETPDATPVDEAGKGDPTKMSNSPSVIPDKIGPDDKNDLGGTGGIRPAPGQPGEEKNDAKGDGDRQADGKVSNKASRLENVQGEGGFSHLPPRQRELIRQAIAGQLPPEYAAAIQQYYINIARGKAAGN